MAAHEPLKDMYGPEIPRRIATMIGAVEPSFPTRAFQRDALDGYEALELTPRARHISTALRRHLPPDYPTAIGILVRSLGDKIDGTDLQGMAGFLYLPHVFFVAEYGRDHVEESLQAQYELTQRFTAEFSIRPFLIEHTEMTLARLREWATDSSVHVRRLVSEGTRPRLPWAPRLPQFQADPSPVLELLELLKDDPELYVRRSVANNLNDIAKDHPDAVIATCRRWMSDASASEARQWLVRRALRTLVRQGDADALAVLGFSDSGASVSILNGEIVPEYPRIGDRIRIAFDIHNDGDRPARLLVDLRVHFVKANGSTRPKVFRVGTAELGPGEETQLRTAISVAQHTTRTHYPGRHDVEVVINGHADLLGAFELQVDAP
jgi:3-methyladenine DNA glycosylase AlkC